MTGINEWFVTERCTKKREKQISEKRTRFGPERDDLLLMCSPACLPLPEANVRVINVDQITVYYDPKTGISARRVQADTQNVNISSVQTYDNMF